jgi:hypothetical protein
MNRSAMTTHNFVLILEGPVDGPTSDLLFEAGLDDAAVTAFDGHPALDVDRDAPSLLFAIASATTQAESVPGVRVLRVEGEELVSQADIAERTGRSRQAVNHWIKRDADSAEFPEPAYGASTRSPLWRWADVQVWLDSDAPADDRGRIIALTNATLLARRNLNDAVERNLVGTLLAAS